MGVGCGYGETGGDVPDGSVLLQITAGVPVAECGGGIPAHLHPWLCPQGRLQRLHQLRGRRGSLQPQECGRAQHHASPNPPNPVSLRPQHLDSQLQVTALNLWATSQRLFKAARPLGRSQASPAPAEKLLVLEHSCQLPSRVCMYIYTYIDTFI